VYAFVYTPVIIRNIRRKGKKGKERERKKGKKMKERKKMKEKERKLEECEWILFLVEGTYFGTIGYFCVVVHGYFWEYYTKYDHHVV
jgi:hypothetical protein